MTQTGESGNRPEETTELERSYSVVGWQGVRCQLPPDWNVTGFSMERESGYLRIDSPGEGNVTVQIRWTDASKPDVKTFYHVLAPHVRRWLRRPPPPTPKIDLKANLEKFLKDIAKQSKKSGEKLDASMKPEKEEGESGERRAMNFSWSGNGRGQGKIWYCSHCNRVLVAQVVGLGKEQNTIANIASRLFSTLSDHSTNGYDLWALYDLQVEIPEGFRLTSQRLLSGQIQLVFQRGAERIVVDRWGLANVTLKKFKLKEWFANNALSSLKRCTMTESEEAGHERVRYVGKLSLVTRLRAIREARLSLRKVPSCYEAETWHCPESNKIYAIQVWRHARSLDVWDEVVRRCVCH